MFFQDSQGKTADAILADFQGRIASARKARAAGRECAADRPWRHHDIFLILNCERWPETIYQKEVTLRAIAPFLSS
jgi:hypothetical protein